MRRTTILIRVALTVVVLGMIGCAKPDRDERLAEMAKHSVETQAQQSERVARQSQQTAEAARLLVEEDAKARREIAKAHADLRRELQEERYPVVCELSSGKVIYDNFEGRWGDQQHLDGFLQSYAVEKARIEARKQGHTITEQQLADGSVKLTINVGGAA